MDSKKWCGTLIVVCPNEVRPFKFRLTPNALLAFALAALISLLMVVIVRYSVPTLAIDRDGWRLSEENQQLRVANRNTAIGRTLLNDRVVRIEERARQIEELLEEQQPPDTTTETSAGNEQ